VVSPASDRIALEVTVDSAQLERELGQVFTSQAPVSQLVGPRGQAMPSTLTPPQPITPPGEDPKDPEPKKRQTDYYKSSLRYLSRLTAVTGIALGITALVKSSTVMSTTVGALNSTLGAMVDSFLAPLVPLLIPAINKLASLIPVMSEAGQSAATSVENVIAAVKGETEDGVKISQAEVGKAIGLNFLDILSKGLIGGGNVYSSPHRGGIFGASTEQEREEDWASQIGNVFERAMTRLGAQTLASVNINVNNTGSPDDVNVETDQRDTYSRSFAGAP
jgi:hypothetical protein